MAALATAFVRVLADTKGLAPGVVAGSQKAGAAGGAAGAKGFRGSFLGGLKGIAGPLAAIFAGTQVLGFFKDAVTGASDLEESVNAVNVTFGDAAKGILGLSRDAAKGVGLSKAEFNGLAVQFSAFANTIAGKGGNVTATIDDITTRAADFASVMNLDVAEAAQLFQSGLAGETEPLRKFGIDLSAAAVQAHAYEKGIADAGEELTEQQKVQARYSLLLKQTSKTQGDFANTSGSLANQQRILGARFDNFKATLGEALLPTITRIVTFMNQSFLPALKAIFRWIGDNKEVLIAFGIGVAAVLVPAFISWAVAAGAAAVATIAAAAPIILIGAAIAGLAFLIIKNWDTVKAATISVWNTVKGVLSTVWNAIKTAVSAAVGFVKRIVSAAWNGIKSVTSTVWNGIRNVINGVLTPIKAIISFALKIIRGNFSGAWSFINSLTRSAWNAIRGLISAAWSRIKSAVSSGVSAVVSFVKRLPGRILGALGNFGSLLYNVGRDLIQGLINGIKSLAGAAVDTVKNIGSSIANGAKGILGIGSPSKVFFQIGIDVGTGLINGITRMRQPVAHAVDDLVKTTTRTPMAKAAKEILRHVRAGGKVFQDFSFRGSSDLVRRLNDQLAQRFNASGRDFTRRDVTQFLRQQSQPRELAVRDFDGTLLGRMRVESERTVHEFDQGMAGRLAMGGAS